MNYPRNLAQTPSSKQPDDANSRPFELEVTKTELKINLLSSKAIGIAKNIAEIFEQNKRLPDSVTPHCPSCSKKFIMLYRKRYRCAICDIAYCLRYPKSDEAV